MSKAEMNTTAVAPGSDFASDVKPEQADEGALNEVSDTDLESSTGALSGWRFWLTMAGLYLGLFLVIMEMTVVSTALVAITNELHDFEHATWIINAYILTWSGFLVLWSQFSHTTGRKSSLLTAVGFFVIFSAGCAAAQTAVQLIILRAIQGLFGAGVFSLPIIIIAEAVPPSALPKYTSFMAVVSVISFAIGPLIGGAIAANSSWRWIFIINVPVGIVALVADSIALPRAFPHHHKASNNRSHFKLASLKQLDVIGGFCFLGGAMFIVIALQEADSPYPWSSPLIICLIVFSFILLAAFAIWERFISRKACGFMPVLSWKFVKRRPMAMFATSFLIGLPYTTTLVQIPQRFQVVNGLSPVDAGIRLLPYILLIPIGTVTGSIISSKFNTRPIYGMLFGALLQLVAVICFATAPISDARDGALPASQYGFQILIGLGNGISYVVNFNGMPYSIDGRKDLVAPAMGANTQFRYLGGAVGLGIVTATLNSYVRSHLSGLLTPSDITSVLQSSDRIATLDAETQAQVLLIFANGFVLQWKIVCGFVGLQIIANLFAY